MARGAADQAQSLEVLAARLGHFDQEAIEVVPAGGALPAAVAVLAAAAQARRGVLGDVHTSAHRAARIAEQRIARRRREPPPREVQATRDQHLEIDQLGDSLLIAGRCGGRQGGERAHRCASAPGRQRSVPARRSTASRWRSTLGCT